jgi:hypothetical protein
LNKTESNAVEMLVSDLEGYSPVARRSVSLKRLDSIARERDVGLVELNKPDDLSYLSSIPANREKTVLLTPVNIYSLNSVC